MKKLFPILLSVFIAFSYGAKKEIEKYPNGNKKSQVKLNKEGQKHGKYKAYFENKEIQITGKYENGNKVGEWSYYNKNGDLFEIRESADYSGSYSNRGEYSGIIVSYYDTGSIKNIESWERGEQSSKYAKWIFNYENGQLQEERNYKKGSKDKQTFYYQNGQIQEEGNYKRGSKDGKQTSYYENGEIKEEQKYKKGNKDGKWTYYNENGSIKKVEEYKDGKLIK